jgi:hypothetical protein
MHGYGVVGRVGGHAPRAHPTTSRSCTQLMLVNCTAMQLLQVLTLFNTVCHSVACSAYSFELWFGRQCSNVTLDFFRPFWMITRLQFLTCFKSIEGCTWQVWGSSVCRSLAVSTACIEVLCCQPCIVQCWVNANMHCAMERQQHTTLPILGWCVDVFAIGVGSCSFAKEFAAFTASLFAACCCQCLQMFVLHACP